MIFWTKKINRTQILNKLQLNLKPKIILEPIEIQNNSKIPNLGHFEIDLRICTRPCIKGQN